MSAPKVLKECQRLLRVTQLCKKSPVRIGWLELPLTLLQIVFLLPFIAFVPYVIWFCVEKEFKLNKIAGAMHLCIGATQLLLIYLGLAMENSNIINHMTELQRIVDQRCEDSPESVEIYEKIEKRNSKQCSFILKATFQMEMGLFILYTLPPIGYALFQFPSPRWWLLPFPATDR
ncbi:uncharacterized protein LOC129570494 [Sitodiplosis mosellana]|uniref:uncharacterized protein LOC129570494 n=1 Tax=Sitodiplosis mosellana TaxID=263140 RepID=UPI0024449F00|nr:uncharacterized protein LOC129570494 [Sitodiplosis mosellana]